MAILEHTKVLVIGGGPAGSYAASALAREGIDTVVLEGDKFPRYHVGESMLPSLRHFFGFIDLDDTFVAHGFYKKIGAAFVSHNKDPAFTDFLGAGGPNAYSWNVVRSESDDLIFRHAGKSGAQIFDGVKVSAIEFAPHEGPSTADDKTQDPGRPVSATWTRKEDGTSGVINFDYIVDASGRMGIMSTKYLKNRHFNQGLKNVASWGYWQGAGRYGVGTPQEGVPYFEALSDGSGWAWFIPLHNNTTSVGVVVNQEIATQKKKDMGSPSGKEFYQEMLKSVPRTLGPMLKDATLVSEIKAASDWSYSASAYASYNARIVGDAGCFIDPFFSSGVHLAVASGLSAAATICASVKGQCSEHEALEWHSKKVAEDYTRFLLIVLSALKQIRKYDEPVLSDWDEEGFERAFAHFRPIIQGTADVHSKLTHLDDVEDVTDRVIRVMGGNPGEMQLQGTNTFLLGLGKARILTDTGEGIPVWIERLVEILKERDLYISHVLLTHWHGDHTGGVADLVAYDATLADRIYKCNPDPGQNDIEDGQTFVVEGATVRALFTPGHAVDHMCFLLEEENTLFTGDNVLGPGFTVVEDLALYLQSLDRMAEQSCIIGYSAHGVRIENLPAKLNQYIRQRRTREKIVYAALLDNMSNGARNANSKSGLSTREIVSKIHGDIPKQLLQSAIEPSTIEILRMLADTRKVGFAMQSDTQRWFINKGVRVA